jgi:hypothetical protein
MLTQAAAFCSPAWQRKLMLELIALEAIEEPARGLSTVSDQKLP